MVNKRRIVKPSCDLGICCDLAKLDCSILLGCCRIPMHLWSMVRINGFLFLFQSSIISTVSQHYLNQSTFWFTSEMAGLHGWATAAMALGRSFQWGQWPSVWVAVKSAPSCFSCFFPILVAAIARTPFHVWARQRLCRRRQVRSKPLWPNLWSGLASSENAQAFTYTCNNCQNVWRQP